MPHNAIQCEMIFLLFLLFKSLSLIFGLGWGCIYNLKSTKVNFRGIANKNYQLTKLNLEPPMSTFDLFIWWIINVMRNKDWMVDWRESCIAMLEVGQVMASLLYCVHNQTSLFLFLFIHKLIRINFNILHWVNPHELITSLSLHN